MFQLLEFKIYDKKLCEEHLYKKKLLLLTGHGHVFFSYSYEQFSATFQDILRNAISELKTI